MNPPKRKGTAWETTVVDHLRTHGAPHAERRAMAGASDRGDIAGIPGVVVECKAERAVDLAGWLAEAEAERVNDRASIAVVWAKRVRKASAEDGYIIMTPAVLLQLLTEAGYITEGVRRGE